MTATRLLILGVLRARQPAHGYEVRRELETWGAGEWANIAYGSIYHALKKMAEEGLLEPVDTDGAEGRPARISYGVTGRGEEEFQSLLREYWWKQKPIVDPFQVALAFMQQMPREELLAALRHRADSYRSAAREYTEYGVREKTRAGAPRHVVENLRLAAAQSEAAATWAEEAIARVERGDLP
ncbi:MAG: PadR family transcriptional regulator [Rubrobacter sp.]